MPHAPRVARPAAAALLLASGAWYLFRPETLVWDRRVDEAPTLAGVRAAAREGDAAAVLLAVGHFHDVRHAGAGQVTIHRRADGTRVLRVSALAVDNGPDLQLYLVAAADAWDDAAVARAGFVSLGALKGNRGNQNYEIPPDVDLARFRAVSVWCRRFGVNYATAPLMTS